MQKTLDSLGDRLRAHGLRILHSTRPTVEWPPSPTGVQSVLIIGHGGSEFWPHFKSSPEFIDGRPDPLDRWSRRVIGAAGPDMEFVSPSEGPPYPPLHALSTGGAMHPSPLGLLAHSEFGLWTAIRGLLLSHTAMPESPAYPPLERQIFAGCFKACPVGAFSETGYAAADCARFLLSDLTAPCWYGCRARRACTQGEEYAYTPDHAKFHMDSFTRAMAKRGL